MADRSPIERKVVLHPRTAAARQQGRRATAGRRTRGYSADSDEVYELVAIQRKLAFKTLALLLTLIFGLPTLMILVPAVTDLPSGPFPPLHWLASGIGLYIALALLGSMHERRANAVDRHWVAERSDR